MSKSSGYKRVDSNDWELRPPTPEEVLEPILKRAKYKPAMFPADPFQAARFWMSKQEPADDFTEAVMPIGKGQWMMPYHERLSRTLKKFLGLKKIHQVAVIDGIDKGMPWRGDEIDFYLELVRQHGVMQQQGKEPYIESVLKAMKKALRKMTE